MSCHPERRQSRREGLYDSQKTFVLRRSNNGADSVTGPVLLQCLVSAFVRSLGGLSALLRMTLLLGTGNVHLMAFLSGTRHVQPALALPDSKASKDNDAELLQPAGHA